MLDGLLYQDRALIDFFDKNMCIMRTEDWPYLSFLREGFRLNARVREEINAEAPKLMELVHERGHLSAQELGHAAGRAALETLYFRGDLVIHHKTGSVRHYALAQDCLPEALLSAPSPFRHERERQMWQVFRRIGAVGMLWNAPSDAWLGVDGLTAQVRDEVFHILCQQGWIVPLMVEDIAHPLFVKAADMPLLERCIQPVCAEKAARLLAPLDGMLWDRKLIASLFGFSYKWEIYTPEPQRRYGYYVLPVLYDEGFIGRIEPVCDRQADALVVKSFWPEPGLRMSDRKLWAMEDELRALQRYLGLGRLLWTENWYKG